MASIVPVPLSQLDEIDNPDSFYVFASKTEPDGTVESGKVLFTELGDVVKKLQLERRISLTMESRETEMFIGEEMTIYRVEAEKVLECRINDIVIPIGKDIEISVPKGSMVKLNVTRSDTDPKSYLFIFAKATLI